MLKVLFSRQYFSQSCLHNCIYQLAAAGYKTFAAGKWDAGVPLSSFSPASD